MWLEVLEIFQIQPLELLFLLLSSGSWDEKNLFFKQYFTVLIIRNATSILTIFSIKSSSNLKPRDSFGICLSWGFRNYPRLLNLMKIWLSYWRLNTTNIISKFIFFSFQSKDENDVLSWIFNISTKSSSNSTIWGCFFWICSSWGFQNTPRLLNLMKIWQKYWRSNISIFTSKWKEVKFWNDIRCV